MVWHGKVRNPVTLLWNVMAALGIGFERHGPPQDTAGNTPNIILPQPPRWRSMQQSPMAELLGPPLLNHTSAASGKTHESGSSGFGITRSGSLTLVAKFHL